jgi:hypothetical protein
MLWKCGGREERRKDRKNESMKEAKLAKPSCVVSMPHPKLMALTLPCKWLWGGLGPQFWEGHGFKEGFIGCEVVVQASVCLFPFPRDIVGGSELGTWGDCILIGLDNNNNAS